MPDIRTRKNVPLRWSTTASDFSCSLRDPSGLVRQDIDPSETIPTTTIGTWRLAVHQNGGKSLTVTVRDDQTQFTQPQSIAKSGQPTVRIFIQVDP